MALETGKEKAEEGIERDIRLGFLISCICFYLSFLFGLFSFLVTAVVAAAQPSPAPSATSTAAQGSPDSGIYGAMVAAWGNAPSNPPTYECVGIFDSTGQRLIATGVCSGIFAQFRIPLAPGRYMVDKSFRQGQPGVPPRAQPGSITVDVTPGQWVNLAPKPLPGPVP